MNIAVKMSRRRKVSLWLLSTPDHQLTIMRKPACTRIIVIPGKRKIACNRLTLAVSVGLSAVSSLGFPRVMRSVREHLIDCENVAKVVVLLTDTWNPRLNTEHIRDVVAHARKGRYVIPHLVSGKRILQNSWW